MGGVDRLAVAVRKVVPRMADLGVMLKDGAAQDWANRESEGILFVPKAGEILYRLKR